MKSLNILLLRVNIFPYLGRLSNVISSFLLQTSIYLYFSPEFSASYFSVIALMSLMTAFGTAGLVNYLQIAFTQGLINPGGKELLKSYKSSLLIILSFFVFQSLFVSSEINGNHLAFLALIMALGNAFLMNLTALANAKNCFTISFIACNTCPSLCAFLVFITTRTQSVELVLISYLLGIIFGIFLLLKATSLSLSRFLCQSISNGSRLPKINLTYDFTPERFFHYLISVTTNWFWTGVIWFMGTFVVLDNSSELISSFSLSIRYSSFLLLFSGTQQVKLLNYDFNDSSPMTTIKSLINSTVKITFVNACVLLAAIFLIPALAPNHLLDLFYSKVFLYTLSAAIIVSMLTPFNTYVLKQNNLLGLYATIFAIFVVLEIFCFVSGIVSGAGSVFALIHCMFIVAAYAFTALTGFLKISKSMSHNRLIRK